MMQRLCEEAIGFLHRTAAGPARIRRRLPPFAAGFFALLVLLTIIVPRLRRK
ncbi:MAG: hypothetical protein AB1558_01145 [Thermodesulfobacteriota bacterium]